LAQHYVVADPGRVVPVAATILRVMLDDERRRDAFPLDLAT
jgi:hypothetical protein